MNILELYFLIFIGAFIAVGLIATLIYSITWHDNSTPIYRKAPERYRYIRPAGKVRKLTRKEIKSIKRHMKED